MVWALFEVKERETGFLPPSRQPFFIPPPPLEIQSEGFNWDGKISPSILLIIIVLAIIFFFSGLLHLLFRFFMKPQHRAEPDELDHNVSAFQGQLQQLFHLHDAGVDQSFIDTLPVFFYKAIIGLKDPFDCAVCLCEFEPEDKLRLLTKCSHAFHMECIDTWLLTHSTCPLCRASLLSDFSTNNTVSSPIVAVLESASNSSRENVSDTEIYANPYVGFHGDSELGSSGVDMARKSSEHAKRDENLAISTADGAEKVVPIKLGKFKALDNNGESSSNCNVDSRRCFSMGSFGYVMDENSSLQVPIRTPMKKQTRKKLNLPLAPGYRAAMSECDCESRREFKFTGAESKQRSDSFCDGNRERSKRIESFSASKIWLRDKKEDKPNGVSLSDSSRRAFSFHFPVNQNRPSSENGIEMWESGEIELDEENQSRNSSDFVANRPSFVRRTLLWLTGRQNRVVHSSFTPNS